MLSTSSDWRSVCIQQGSGHWELLKTQRVHVSVYWLAGLGFRHT